MSALDAKRKYLRQKIVISELMAHLMAEEIITLLQRDHIESFGTEYRKNVELLDILSRRSYAAFKGFINCLKKTGQHHVAHILETSGGIFAELLKYPNF